MKDKITKLILSVLTIFIVPNIIKAADYIWPIEETNAYETAIEYGYGVRAYRSNAYDQKYNYAPYEGTYNAYENHYGVDIAGIKGHTYNVISVANGTVITTSLDQLYNPSLYYVDRNQRKVTNDGGGYGNYVVIKEDGTGRCFLYAHLKAYTVTVNKGDRVTKGQIIGVMGSSGSSGHMHLHFEVRPNESKVLTSYGRDLVPTYKYGVETENPVLYIGSQAPAKPEIKEEEKVPEERTYPVPPAPEKKTVDLEERVPEERTYPVPPAPETKKQEDKVPAEKIYPTPLDPRVPNKDVVDFVTPENDPQPKDSIPPRVVYPIPNPARLLQIRTEEQGSKVTVYFTFNKNVEVIEAPTLYVQLEKELKEAKYEGQIRKHVIAYSYNMEDFDVLGSGTVYGSLLRGKIVNEDNNNTTAIYQSNNKMLNHASEMKINESFIPTYKNLGDLDLDGFVDAIDASYALQIAEKLTIGQPLTQQEQDRKTRADVNLDGFINAEDASIILDHYGKLSTGWTKNKFSEILSCDMNDDDIVDRKDYIILKNQIEKTYEEKYDINKDKKLDQKDIEEFKNILKKYGKRA